MLYSLYIGGYGDRSITRVTLRDGRLIAGKSFDAENASWLCLSKDGTRLYAVSETEQYRGEKGGSASSFAIDESGDLTLTSTRAVGGTLPCHMVIADDLLVISNYGSGSLSRFGLCEDGRIGDALPLIQHSGDAHVHHAAVTWGGWLAVTDLGLDTVSFYPVNELRREQPEPLVIHVPHGYGPRHCAFSRRADAWYALCENRSELLIYRGTPSRSVLVGRVPVGDGTAKNYPAALRFSPDERMLLATGRGQNVLTLFSVNENGLLSRLTEVSSMGDWPRDAQFSPDGKYVVCANQRGDTVTAYAVSEGHLEYRSSLSVHAPSCVIFHTSQEE